MQWKFGAWFPQNTRRVQDVVPPQSLIKLSSANLLLKLTAFEKVMRKQMQGFSNIMDVLLLPAAQYTCAKKMEIYILSARYLFFPLTISGLISLY